METALLIFTVLLIEFIYEPISVIRNNQIIKTSYGIFNNYVKEFIEKKFFIYILFIIFSILLIIIIKGFLYSYIHWSLSFLFSFIILFYCLRSNEFNEKINDLKFIIQNKKEIEDDSIINLLGINIRFSNPSNNLFQKISENLFFSSTRNIFSVIFWFLLLGPGGALGYKLLDYLVFTNDLRVDKKSKDNLKEILALVEFFPIRLSSLAFATVGNFEHALNTWKKFNPTNKNLHESNIELINKIGFSSAQLESNYNDEDILEKISYIQTLIARSLLAWLSITLLLILGGFFN